MALDGGVALAMLEQIDDRNAKREFYLTDAVAIARRMGRKVVAIETEEDEVRGINTPGEYLKDYAPNPGKYSVMVLDKANNGTYEHYFPKQDPKTTAPAATRPGGQ